MAKNKLGSKESLNDILFSRMAVIRQWDKKQALSYLIPQRIEDEKLYNFKNQVIMSFEGEDCVFHEDASVIDDAGRVTEKLLTDIYKPINDYFGPASKIANSEVDPNVEGDEPEDDEEIECNDDVTESDDNDDMIVDIVTTVKSFIKDGELKAAKKFLKKYEDHDDYKKAKKMLKKAGK